GINSEKNENISIDNEEINPLNLSKNTNNTEPTESTSNQISRSLFNELGNDGNSTNFDHDTIGSQEETLNYPLCNFFNCCEQFLKNSEKNNININTSNNFIPKLTFGNGNELEDYNFSSMMDNSHKTLLPFVTFPEIFLLEFA
ncbi:MAG: hypothetical protein HUJ79_01810, partial [Firmicutes bacterium]|nr:hypothetical protein [Bacillota bacterium]